MQLAGVSRSARHPSAALSPFIRYPSSVLFEQLAQEGEAPACADLSRVAMCAEERASKRLRAHGSVPARRFP